jgi:hypothetical protein
MADFNPLPTQLQQPQFPASSQQAPQPAFSQGPMIQPPSNDAMDASEKMQPPQMDAQQVEMQHHSMVGKLAQFVMGNQVSFEPQPDGSVQKVVKPAKPGELFRGMLLSGILGTGTQAHGFGEGFAKGISGTTERDIENKDKARAEAIQNEQLKRQKTAAEDIHNEHMDKHADAIARAHVNTLNTAILSHHLHSLPEESMVNQNNANQASYDAAITSGGSPVQIVDPKTGKDLNGQMGNDARLGELLMQNKDLAVAPDKQHIRHVLHFVNTDALKQVAEVNDDGQWVDKKTKKVVDANQFSTIRVVDQPINSLGQMIPMTGAEVNRTTNSKIYSGDQLTQTFNVSQNDLGKIREQSLKEGIQQQTINLDKARIKHESELADKSLSVAEKNNQTAMVQTYKPIFDQLKQEAADRLKADPTASVQDIRQRWEDVNAQFTAAMGTVNPAVQKAVDAATKHQQNQQDLAVKTRNEKISSLSKGLPKAAHPGAPFGSTDQMKKFFDAAGGDPQLAMDISIANGFNPHAAIPEKSFAQKAEGVAGSVKNAVSPFFGGETEDKHHLFKDNTEKPTI